MSFFAIEITALNDQIHLTMGFLDIAGLDCPAMPFKISAAEIRSIVSQAN